LPIFFADGRKDALFLPPRGPPQPPPPRHRPRPLKPTTYRGPVPSALARGVLPCVPPPRRAADGRHRRACARLRPHAHGRKQAQTRRISSHSAAAIIRYVTTAAHGAQSAHQQAPPHSGMPGRRGAALCPPVPAFHYSCLTLACHRRAGARNCAEAAAATAGDPLLAPTQVAQRGTEVPALLVSALQPPQLERQPVGENTGGTPLAGACDDTDSRL
jgi:hypothetical protein